MKTIFTYLTVITGLVLILGCAENRINQKAKPIPPEELKTLSLNIHLLSSPYLFIKKYSKFHERCTPRILWEFSKDGTFKSYSLTSSYGFAIKGKWTPLATGQILIKGETFNTRSKKKTLFTDIIKNITMLEKTAADKTPTVKIEFKNKNTETRLKESFNIKKNN
jgi:hypothetical protein